jgi:DNA-binding response OmpR family regulator
MKILIIEDDKFFREFYALKFKEQSAEVAIAADGEEGLQKIAENRPDVILLDLIMPKKDGFDVLQVLAKETAAVHIPVLVFSTLGQEKDIEKAMQLGAKGYVNKSFYDFDVLYNKVLEVSGK